VEEGPGISYSWRSIVRGIKALKAGMIWRVGDGSHINIWLDPWVPRGVTRRPITPRGQSLVTRGSELIDPVSGDWDQGLIKDIFWEQDVQDILAIPVHIGREDIIAWHFDKKGTFSVKSAYHNLHDQASRAAKKQKGEPSTIHQGKKLTWKHVWKLKCAPKIKHFLWRLAHNSLPLQMNIKTRGMDIDTRCPACWRLNEDGGHCFLRCKFAVHCWRKALLEDVQFLLLQKALAYEVVTTILSLNDDTCIKAASLMHALWEARNKANAGEGVRQTSQVVQHAAMLAV
jgi:hypothetical protein